MKYSTLAALFAALALLALVSRQPVCPRHKKKLVDVPGWGRCDCPVSGCGYRIKV